MMPPGQSPDHSGPRQRVVPVRCKEKEVCSQQQMVRLGQRRTLARVPHLFP